jgi:hypothetical protein
MMPPHFVSFYFAHGKLTNIFMEHREKLKYFLFDFHRFLSFASITRVSRVKCKLHAIGESKRFVSLSEML